MLLYKKLLLMTFGTTYVYTLTCFSHFGPPPEEHCIPWERY